MTIRATARTIPASRIYLVKPYVAYHKVGYSKKSLAEHESDILLYKVAKKAFDEPGVKNLPTIKRLQTEYAVLLADNVFAEA